MKSHAASALNHLNGRPSRIALVSIVGSAGGLFAMREILSRLPADFPAPIIYLQHLSASRHSALVDVLQWRSALPVRWAEQGDLVKPGVVYVCPPECYLAVCPEGAVTLASIDSRRDAHYAADRFLASVAASFTDSAVAIVLSGVGWDGREGICAVHARGGAVLVQDEASAVVWGMPRAAVGTGEVDMIVPLQTIAPLLLNLVRGAESLEALRIRIIPPSGQPSVPRVLVEKLGDILSATLAEQSTDLGNIQLADPGTDGLVIVTQRGFSLDFLDHFSIVRQEDGAACGRAMRGRSGVFIPDVDADPDFAAHRDIARSAGFRAVQSMPLVSRDGALLGVLSAHFRYPRRPAREQLRSFDHYARKAADAVQILGKLA